MSRTRIDFDLYGIMELYQYAPRGARMGEWSWELAERIQDGLRIRLERMRVETAS